jgi:galactose mutarotase-like enzyme
MKSHKIAGAGFHAEIRMRGAELCSLKDGQGREYLWQAGPAWQRHAPNLFPIVGRLKDDKLRHAGKEYRLTQHGFARDRDFVWEERAPDRCRLSLQEDTDTLASYPFAFRFEVLFCAENDGLSVRYKVTNPGKGTLPVSLGAHPAFLWPLAEGIRRESHSLTFSQAEEGMVRRLSGGLLHSGFFESPVEGNILNLNEELFTADALIFEKPASRSVRYSAPDTPVIEVSWDDGFRELGLWTKPGAGFLCIEPWHGIASPADFDGEFTGKPGLLLIPSGESRSASWQVRIVDHN